MSDLEIQVKISSYSQRGDMIWLFNAGKILFGYVAHRDTKQVQPEGLRMKIQIGESTVTSSGNIRSHTQIWTLTQSRNICLGEGYAKLMSCEYHETS